jgi:hypothetical protein
MAKNKNMTFEVVPNTVVFTSISKEMNGYNSARMVVKAGDKEYMHISYEWEGTGVPDFAMNLMEFMKNNNVETSGVWPGQEKAYVEFSAKEKMCPDCKMPMSECECEEEDEEEAKKKMTPEEFKLMIEEKKKKKKKASSDSDAELEDE